MADLSKYVEFDEFRKVSGPGSSFDYLNERLAAGWRVVSVKIIEVQDRVGSSSESYIKKEPQTIYVLGKPERLSRDFGPNNPKR